MKKILAFIFVLAFTLSFAGCNEQASGGCGTSPKNTENSLEGVADFSYEKEQAIYNENTPGVKCNGFANTSKSTLVTDKDAIELAKNEVTIEWNTTRVYFDSKASVWKVVFFTFTEGTVTVGGDQSVYMDKNGKTILIVYGE